MNQSEIAQLQPDIEKDIKELDSQIEYLETLYLEETKEAGNIIKGFQNYVNVKLNPRGGVFPKRIRVEPRQRLFSLTSTKCQANNIPEAIAESRQQALNGIASNIAKRNKRKKNYAHLDQGYKDYDGGNEGDSNNNSENVYEDYDSKIKKKR